MAPTKLDALPNELLALIFDFLPQRGLFLVIRLVCSRWNRVALLSLRRLVLRPQRWLPESVILRLQSLHTLRCKNRSLAGFPRRSTGLVLAASVPDYPARAKDEIGGTHIPHPISPGAIDFLRSRVRSYKGSASMAQLLGIESLITLDASIDEALLASCVKHVSTLTELRGCTDALPAVRLPHLRTLHLLTRPGHTLSLSFLSLNLSHVTCLSISPSGAELYSFAAVPTSGASRLLYERPSMPHLRRLYVRPTWRSDEMHAAVEWLNSLTTLTSIDICLREEEVVLFETDSRLSGLELCYSLNSESSHLLRNTNLTSLTATDMQLKDTAPRVLASLRKLHLSVTSDCALSVLSRCTALEQLELRLLSTLTAPRFDTQPQMLNRWLERCHPWRLRSFAWRSAVGSDTSYHCDLLCTIVRKWPSLSKLCFCCTRPVRITLQARDAFRQACMEAERNGMRKMNVWLVGTEMDEIVTSSDRDSLRWLELAIKQ